MIKAPVIDFFEYKFNGRITIVENPQNRLKDYLEAELAEALRKDTERGMDDF